MQFWKMTSDNVNDFALIFVEKKGPKHESYRGRHNKDQICLKLSYEKIFIVFFQTDKSTELRKCSSIQTQR